MARTIAAPKKGIEERGYTGHDETTAVDFTDHEQDAEAVEAEEVSEESTGTSLQLVPREGDDSYEQQENMSTGLALRDAANKEGGKKKTLTGTSAAGPQLLSQNYELTKFKVKDNLLEAEYVLIMNYQDVAPVRKSMKAAGGLPVHPDLINLVRALVPFLAHATEQEVTVPVLLEADDEMPKNLAKYHVSGVSIGTDGGFVISGTRTLRGNRKLPINTPHIQLDKDDNDSWYPYAADLETVMSHVVREVILHLDGKGFSAQMSLFEEEAA